MSLEQMKKKLELARVTVAKQELEYRILERQEEIERLKEHIKVQEAHELKLKQELGE